MNSFLKAIGAFVFATILMGLPVLLTLSVVLQWNAIVMYLLIIVNLAELGMFTMGLASGGD